MTNTITKTFDSQPLTFRMWKGRPAITTGEFGEGALDYSEGRYLVDQIRGPWREEFAEGIDYDLLTGDDLALWGDSRDESEPENDASTPVDHRSRAPSLPQRGARSLQILYESGMYLAAILARTKVGTRVRRWLASEVLPAIRSTGQYTRGMAGSGAALLLPEAEARAITRQLPHIIDRRTSAREQRAGMLMVMTYAYANASWQLRWVHTLLWNHRGPSRIYVATTPGEVIARVLANALSLFLPEQVADELAEEAFKLRLWTLTKDERGTFIEIPVMPAGAYELPDPSDDEPEGE